jgi:hypothetical protein
MSKSSPWGQDMQTRNGASSSLICGLKGLLLYVCGKVARLYLMVCTHLWSQLHLMIGSVLLLLWLKLQASSCHCTFNGTLDKTTSCMFLVMTRFLFRCLCFLVPPPLPVPLFALPDTLVAMADALPGMLNLQLLLLLPLPAGRGR